MSKICPGCGKEYDEDYSFCLVDGEVLVDELDYEPEEGDGLVGKVLEGRYELVDVLGSGGMATVFLGRQASMDREVAVKVMHEAYARDEMATIRFLREAKAASKLVHPNTITVHDFGRTEDGILYMVMERLRGRTLRDIVDEEGHIEAGRAVAILTQICDSLGQAHDLGIFHRDLKPENIVITDTYGNPNHVTVLDFGIAKIIDDTRGGTTVAGSICGTPEFMSPEQANSAPVDARSDIYALGVLLYYMLTGVRPFTAPSVVALLYKHIHEPPPPMDPEVIEATPAPLLELLEKMLAKDRERRPPDCATLKAGLIAAIEERPKRARKAKRGGDLGGGDLKDALTGTQPAIKAVDREQRDYAKHLLPVPVALRLEPSGAAVQLLAADGTGGVMFPAATGARLDAGAHYHLSSDDPHLGPVGVEVVINQSAYGFGGLDGCVLVSWERILAYKHRQYLVNVLRNVLGVGVSVPSKPEVLGPEERLTYTLSDGAVNLDATGVPIRATAHKQGAVRVITPNASVPQQPSVGRGGRARPGKRRKTGSGEPGDEELFTTTQGFQARAKLRAGGTVHAADCVAIGHSQCTLMVKERPRGLTAGGHAEIGLEASRVGTGEIWLTGVVRSLRNDPASGRTTFHFEIERHDGDDDQAFMALVDYWRKRLGAR